ncbi:MAG: D-alanyl-D-alanine carboxypeptidase [Firmicutes bacterium]|nr:D-alanyl-D-alanine carboxypeptidase [Bacillota bacterium]
MNIKFRVLIAYLFFAVATSEMLVHATPEIKAQSAILATLNGDQILFEKNADKKMYPANLTKLMTALVAYGRCNEEDTVIISEDIKNYISPFDQTMNLKPGEGISAGDLLKAIIIGSYNDAAIALSLHCAETPEAFVDIMNEQAVKLNLFGTNFANPTGEHSEMNYTTVRDMLLIYKKIYSIPFLRDIVDKAYTTIPATSKSKERTFWTSNSLSNGYYSLRYLYNYAKGGKASASTFGGSGVACTAVKGNSRFICVVLGSVQDESVNYSFIDAKNIFEYGFNNFVLKTVLRQNDIVSEIKVKNAKGEGRTLLLAEKTVQCYVKNDDDVSNVEQIKNVPESIVAPLKEGDAVGSVVYTYNGYPVGEAQLLAEGDVAASKIKFLFGSILWFVSLRYVKLFLIVIFGAVAAYAIVVASVLIKAHKSQKIKKADKTK